MHTAGNRIEACDSIVLSFRQRRKIVELLYHMHTAENGIEACDSIVLSLRQRRKIVELLYNKKQIYSEKT